MAIVKIIKGDLIKLFKAGKFDVIGHGANCRNLMGAGIARVIAAQIPEALKADADFYKRMGGADSLPCASMAGHISTASVDVNGQVKRVVNLYTQIQTGKNADYQLLQAAAEKLNSYCKQRSVRRVGLPLIGAGIGGLDVIAALTIISQATPDVDVTIVILPDDELNWKTVQRKMRNFGFPVAFDSVCVRIGVDSWSIYQTDTQSWALYVFDINQTKVHWHNGEYAVSFGDYSPETYLLIENEDKLEENKLRILE